MTATAIAEGPITLVGVVRDFRSDHPDFGVTPVLGGGHSAGNAAFDLDDRERPIFGGGDGFEVASQWRNALGNPIAPHLFVDAEDGVVRLRSEPDFDNSADIDSYDYDLGAYDPDNPGPDPVFSTDYTMPEIPVPESVPALEGSFYRDGGGVTEISGDRHFSWLIMRNSHLLRIIGDVTIHVDGDFFMDQKPSIELAADSSLTLYVGGRLHLRNSCNINAGQDPDNVQVYKSGTGDIIIGQSAEVFANILAPWAPMLVTNFSDFYGSFDGASLRVDNNAGFHVDGIPPVNACGQLILDDEGIEGFDSAGDITSDSSFANWYRDIDGINASKRHAVTLHPAGRGFYEYKKAAFFPVDEQLYGNEGRSHNLHFTYQIDTHFVYQSCMNQVVEIQGTDDIWVFVNDQLVIDLGGIGADQVQVGEMDRLNLVDGETYTMRIFYAHRSNNRPSFRLRTNIPLSSSLLSTNVPVYAGWD